jgi:alkylation response protein AidB-like acyl-CoA dehydrogenase
MSGLGWLAVGVPAQHGGVGGSLADQAMVFRELGRGLAPGPLIGTAAAVSIAVLAGRDDLAASLMSGDSTAALAEPWRDPSASVSASSGVSGRFRVLDPEDTDLVAVLAAGGACLVSGDDVRPRARRLPAPDPSVTVSLAELDGASAGALLASTEHAGLVAARGRILTAALLVGILEAVRDSSVAYVSARQQFGKPIGSFQAVKHRCADMAVRAEAAASLLWLAALSLDRAELDAAGGDGDCTDRDEAFRLAASVKALASEYAVLSAHENVQNHGGMGFTAECSAHLYVKRALEWSVTLGSPEVLLAEVAR